MAAMSLVNINDPTAFRPLDPANPYPITGEITNCDLKVIRIKFEMCWMTKFQENGGDWEKFTRATIYCQLPATHFFKVAYSRFSALADIFPRELLFLVSKYESEEEEKGDFLVARNCFEEDFSASAWPNRRLMFTQMARQLIQLGSWHDAQTSEQSNLEFS